MQGNVTGDQPLRKPPGIRFEETELERRGTKFDFGAPVTGAVAVASAVAVSFGDGTVRFFRPGLGHSTVEAHKGVILCITTDGTNLLTGGDDGRFLRISPHGEITQLASFGTKWVDCVAASVGQYACSSGRTAQIWSVGQVKPSLLEHGSTIGGMAFDSKGKRFAVAHYGGTTLWERGERRWKSSKLVWKGFHGAVTFSPDGKYVITAMQENSLHGWRIRDKSDLAMTGYPAKVKSFTWVGDTPHLVTSGAEEAICWPFDGKKGPMGRSPICVGHAGRQTVTHVKALPKEKAVFAGFRDGTVLLSELDESKETIIMKSPNNSGVTAIAVSDCLSHLLIGDEKGQVLWTPLWAGKLNAEPI